jgi:hypothetical protein
MMPHSPEGYEEAELPPASNGLTSATGAEPWLSISPSEVWPKLTLVHFSTDDFGTFYDR